MVTIVFSIQNYSQQSLQFCVTDFHSQSKIVPKRFLEPNEFLKMNLTLINQEILINVNRQLGESIINWRVSLKDHIHNIHKEFFKQLTKQHDLCTIKIELRDSILISKNINQQNKKIEINEKIMQLISENYKEIERSAIKYVEEQSSKIINSKKLIRRNSLSRYTQVKRKSNYKQNSQNEKKGPNTLRSSIRKVVAYNDNTLIQRNSNLLSSQFGMQKLVALSKLAKLHQCNDKNSNDNDNDNESDNLTIYSNPLKQSKKKSQFCREQQPKQNCNQQFLAFTSQIKRKLTKRSLSKTKYQYYQRRLNSILMLQRQNDQCTIEQQFFTKLFNGSIIPFKTNGIIIPKLVTH